ncbi:MAG: AAA family ATPase, partial [Clostridia bacterium]|nr:AAA family ATPase [Clostridia bacterium]
NKKLLEAFEKALNDIKKAKEQIGRVNFIKEQRLLEERQISEDRRSYGESKKEFIKVLKSSSNSLIQEMERVMSKHSILSNELDSTYIKRLFETNGKMSSEDFDKKLISLKERQALLNKYELASIIRNTSNLKYVNEFEKDLYRFFDDNQKKYDIFEPLIQKITLYEQIINNKLTFKKLKISRSNGIQVVSDDNKDLELSKLSSGEQEILVLYYKLIFESDVDLLMIDEPEISLHIAWQKNILKDLKEIVKLNNKLNIIIATHSPQIISDNWDLQIDLGGQYNG